MTNIGKDHHEVVLSGAKTTSKQLWSTYFDSLLDYSIMPPPIMDKPIVLNIYYLTNITDLYMVEWSTPNTSQTNSPYFRQILFGSVGGRVRLDLSLLQIHHVTHFIGDKLCSLAFDSLILVKFFSSKFGFTNVYNDTFA